MHKMPQSTKPKPKTAIKPVWSGPEQDGITFSLLSRFLCCRERFRLLVMKGLREREQFNHRIHYGQMWHVCEEFYAKAEPGYNQWDDCLKAYAKLLCSRFPMQQEQIEHWYNVCKVQFPIYVNYWAKHPDVTSRTPLLQEQVFDVSYQLPSGRMVRLRGKWDSVDLIGKGKNAGIYLQENKTKSDINEQQIKRQLSFDLQTMLYLVALERFRDIGEDSPGSRVPARSAINDINAPACGVRYNVVRRPLSGGKGSIVQHKSTKSNPNGETKEHFYKRLGEVIVADSASYFMRWRVGILPSDIERFRRECLDPILEQLCDWWSCVVCSNNPFKADMDLGSIHWRTPYGIWNSLLEGGSTELDEYLASGSELGLERTESLFGELE